MLGLKFVWLCLVASLMPAYAFTTQYYGHTQHAVLPNHCFYEEFDLAVPVNETLYPTGKEYECVKITCREDYVLMIKHCDRILAHQGCTITPYDYSKMFPDCCYKMLCV